MGEQVYYKITDKGHIRLLLGLCWIVYFSTYLGRLNYSASLAEMIRTEGFSKGQAGLIGTGFFFAYGAGQLISGFLGDKLSPRNMVFTGMLVSGICNFCMSGLHQVEVMAVVWCINGLFQAFIWSPMVRLLFEYFETKTRMKACVSLNTSVPIGTMAAYGLTAGIIWLSGWRMVFRFSSIVLLVIAAIWFLGFKKLEDYAKVYGKQEEIVAVAAKNAGTVNWKSLMMNSGLVFLLFVLVVQGALKDGVTTWVPTYISETYGVGSILAIITTMVIPVFNLVGVYLASYADLHWFHDEVRTSGIFFAVCGAALAVLWISSGKSLVLSFIMLALATTAMMAVNTMMIAVVPSYFGMIGRASSVSGLLNSFVYAGGAVSTYGIGALSVAVGWKRTIFCWVALAVISTSICVAVWRKWKRYRREMLNS